MSHPYRLVAAFVLPLLAGLARPVTAGDWSQWRGPERTGVAADGPALADHWPKQGPPRIWESESIPGDNAFGFSSVVVAGDRVVLYVPWQYTEPVATRRVTDDVLNHLGRPGKKLPAEISEPVEAARISDERAALKKDAVGAWARKWIEAHLTPEQRKQFEGVVNDRLARGREALPLEAFDKLAQIRNKELATAAELDAWIKEGGFGPEAAKLIVAAVPTTRNYIRDTVLCLSAETGKTLWKTDYPGVGTGWGISSTPCIQGDRVYASGSSGLYCLELATGHELWKATRNAGHASLLVAGDAVIVPGSALTALDTAGGRQLWTQPKAPSESTSPALWKNAQESYVLLNGKGKLVCVSLKTGEILWNVPGVSGSSTPVVADDTAVVLSDKANPGLVAFKLSSTGAERLWNIAIADPGATAAVCNGEVYISGDGRLLRVNLATGKPVWDQKAGAMGWSSPLIAGDKLVFYADDKVALVDAVAPTFKLLAKAPVRALRCTSPCVSQGKLFVRTPQNVACYDLRHVAEPATSPATKPAN